MRALEARDAGAFVMNVSNTATLDLVLANLSPLKSRGIYEAALLRALTGTRTNHAHVAVKTLHQLLRVADRERLRAAGPFRLFRGVSGAGAGRRIRGIHWTGTPAVAAWFAQRFNMADPAVYEATVSPCAVLAYSAGREEDDFIVMLPASVPVTRLDPMPSPPPRSEAETQAAG
jgi:hypothetical protein